MPPKIRVIPRRTPQAHPFYVWTRADARKAGDLIVIADAEVVRVATTE